MKIALTGSGGFTGKHFVNCAQKAGFQVVPIVSDINKKHELETELIAHAPDYLLHLAGKSYTQANDPTPYYATHVLGTLNLLEACLKLKRHPEKILVSSSSSIYDVNSKCPVLEECPAHPHSHYGISKYAMELCISKYFDVLPLVISRPFNYTGQGQSTDFVVPKIVNAFQKRFSNLWLGNVSVRREFNDVRMVCEAYKNLLIRGVPGQSYNVCSGNSCSILSIIGAMEEISGHALTIKEDRNLIRESEVQDFCGSNSKLRRDTGEVTEFAIFDTLTWMFFGR